jgi:hypothetical protein
MMHIQAGITPSLSMKMPPASLYRLHKGITVDGAFPLGFGSLSMAVSMIDARSKEKIETLISSELSLTSRTEVEATIDGTKAASVLKAIYFLLINLLAVGCVETPPTGVGSLGTSADHSHTCRAESPVALRIQFTNPLYAQGSRHSSFGKPQGRWAISGKP